jgi:8-oxo-dGTP diphosphatase
VTDPNPAAPRPADPRPAASRQACAGGIVFDPAQRLLVIRRGQPPSAGLWSVPGGRCRPGETAASACVREVAEETGQHVRVVGVAGRVERDGPNGVVYDIDDFVCVLADPHDASASRPQAGDDAADARWVTHAELVELELAPQLYDCLATWGLLPS